MDLSFRIWRCGGDIVSAPQSYIAHMWRDSSKPNTVAKYRVPGNAAVVNRARAMMGHAPDMFAQKTIFFPMFSSYKRTGGSDLDVSSIHEPMTKLQCKDMNYYWDFFSYIYRDGGYLPKQVYQLTPDAGTTCLQLKSNRVWNSDGPADDKPSLAPCTNLPGLEATAGTQYWHPANPTSEGVCCSSLRAWNTDQCISTPTRTFSCNNQANSQQKAQLQDNGTIVLGSGKCLSASGSTLSATSCSSATKWDKLRPFVPQEFTALSPELKAKW